MDKPVPIQPETTSSQNVPETGQQNTDQPQTNQPATGQPETTVPRQGRLTFSFIANKDVNIPIIFAMVGFLLSILILHRGCGNANGYHDIYLENKKELIINTIKKRKDTLENIIESLRELKVPKAVDVKAKDEPADKQARLKAALKALSISETELNSLTHGNIDTSMGYYLRYFSVDRAEYLKGISLIDSCWQKVRNERGDTVWKKSIENEIVAAIRDSSSAISEMPLLTINRLRLKQQTRTHQFSFFSDYPIFGFWYFLSIAQMTLWFLLIPVVVGIAKRADAESDLLKFTTPNALVFCLLPSVIVALFAIMFYWVIVDFTVIPDHYFMDGYNAKMLGYGIPGYLVAIICFGVYLFLSNKWEILEQEAKTRQISIATNEELHKRYDLLRSMFNTAFLCSAIILSVFVFWVGLLFNSINSLEAMNFYFHLSGKKFLNYDLVYLLGLMHTLLLLIFYVPVHLRFNALDITLQHETKLAESSTTARKFGKGFVDIISTILVTTSPLLATVLQKVIALIFPE